MKKIRVLTVKKEKLEKENRNYIGWPGFLAIEKGINKEDYNCAYEYDEKECQKFDGEINEGKLDEIRNDFVTNKNEKLKVWTGASTVFEVDGEAYYIELRGNSKWTRIPNEVWEGKKNAE